jgi:hypothetical protein
MSMVEVRHRASEASQKPSIHETAGHESRLWIFDPVSSRAFLVAAPIARTIPIFRKIVVRGPFHAQDMEPYSDKLQKQGQP